MLDAVHYDSGEREEEHTSQVGDAVAIVSGAVLWWFCCRRTVVMKCGEHSGRPICCTNSACESNRHTAMMVRDKRRRQRKLNINQQGHVFRSLNELEQKFEPSCKYSGGNEFMN